MKIKDVLYTTGQSGYFHVDFAAVRMGRDVDGFVYRGKAVTSGFTSIVEPASTVSVMLLLDDGQVAFGDCTDVVYSGVYGRDPVFLPSQHLQRLESEVADALRGAELGSFQSLARQFDSYGKGHQPLHIAIRYGITQALLHAVSLAHRQTMTEVLAREYAVLPSTHVIPIMSTGEIDDNKHLDRMILKQVDLLPHSYYQSARRQLTRGAENLIDYIGFVARRVAGLGGPDYRPRLVIDMGGTLGDLFGNNIDNIVDCLGRAEQAAFPFELLIEGPVTGKTQAEHIQLFHAIKRRLEAKAIGVPIIADEWCNTLQDIEAFTQAHAADYLQIKMPDLGGINNSVEAVLYCKAHGMGAFLGGSYNETDQSARVSTHIALATSPDFMIAKPGRGGDEGIMIQRNEMARSLALMKRGCVRHKPD